MYYVLCGTKQYASDGNMHEEHKDLHVKDNKAKEH